MSFCKTEMRCHAVPFSSVISYYFIDTDRFTFIELNAILKSIKEPWYFSTRCCHSRLHPFRRYWHLTQYRHNAEKRGVRLFSWLQFATSKLVAVYGCRLYCAFTPNATFFARSRCRRSFVAPQIINCRCASFGRICRATTSAPPLHVFTFCGRERDVGEPDAVYS